MAEILRYTPYNAVNDEGDVVHIDNLSSSELDGRNDPNEPYVWNPSDAKIKSHLEDKEKISQAKELEKAEKKKKAERRRRLRKGIRIANNLSRYI